MPELKWTDGKLYGGCHWWVARASRAVGGVYCIDFCPRLATERAPDGEPVYDLRHVPRPADRTLLARYLARTATLNAAKVLAQADNNELKAERLDAQRRTA